MDAKAYWHAHHGTGPLRGLISAPATYQDLLHASLVNRGIDPAKVRERAAKAARTGNRPPVRCNVHGGQWTPDIQERADLFRAVGMQKDWSRTTGSTSESITWWTSPDRSA